MNRIERVIGRVIRGEISGEYLWIRLREVVRVAFGGRGQDRAYFERLYREEDPWGYQTSEYEQAKYATTLRLLPDRHFARALEVGCSIGIFTEKLALAGRAEKIVGLDISTRAAKRAAERCRRFAGVRIEEGDLIEFNSEERFDLILCAEVLYYLWERPRDRNGVRRQLAALLMPEGVLVVALGGDSLVQDWEGFLQEDPRLRLMSRHEFDDPSRPYRISFLRGVAA
jgi:SAM-dependent methyltransferase